MVFLLGTTMNKKVFRTMIALYGTFLIRVPSHLTVIKNGVLYDIWDCRHELCDTVWKRVD